MKERAKDDGELKKRFEEIAEKLSNVVGSHMRSNVDVLNATIAQNNKGATFYERLLVADGAIIALSLSFLGTLASRPSVPHLSRHSFYTLVCPAWGLLLFAMFLELHQLRMFHQSNILMIERGRQLSDEYHVFHMGQVQKEMSRLVAPLAAGEVSKQISDNADKSLAVAKKIRADSDAEILKATGKKWRQKLQGWTLMLCNEVAILLLCIFTVNNLPLA
jgi:hypothetical protein